MPISWNFNGQGAFSVPGSVFSSALGTAVSFSAFPTVGYTGLALVNPATVAGKTPVKLVPLRVSLTPIGTSGVQQSVPFGFVKLTGQGTASNGGLSAYSGAIFAPGYQGTVPATVPVAQLGGTFSVINGTAAGTGSNTLYWQEMVGAVNAGTGIGGGGASTAADLTSFVCAMPGETLAIGVQAAVTCLASISWVEVPLTSGA